MVKYSLSHLTQEPSQMVSGPIQDDEALVLFSIIRCMRMRTVIEIGGLSGYSATNFCEAVGPSGKVITVDINKVPQVAANHAVIQGDATKLTKHELLVDRFDLVFLDCHVYDVQMNFVSNLLHEKLIDDDTVIAIHDTNTHPYQSVPYAYKIPGGWVHQPVERRMVNDLQRAGYDALCLHTSPDRHDDSMPYRHG